MKRLDGARVLALAGVVAAVLSCAGGFLLSVWPPVAGVLLGAGPGVMLAGNLLVLWQGRKGAR